MDRKRVLIQGAILIAITMVSNIFLTNWIFTERIKDVQSGQRSLADSADHIFTALTYMERNSKNEFNSQIKRELDEARKSLRAPELISIRRSRKK